MTHDEINKTIYNVERNLSRIFNNVPNFAKVAMPGLVREAEDVIESLVILRTRLIREGIQRGEAKEPEYWRDQLSDLPARKRGA